MSRLEPQGKDPHEDTHVRVWDLPVRIFHWTIVLLSGTSWIAADRGFMRLHLWSGLTLFALLLFRIVWGVWGSTTARFRDFVYPPRTVLGYLRTLVAKDSPRHAGHNPPGGWMVVALIALLCAQVASGLFANDGLRFNGPLALYVTADTSDRLTSIHATLFNILLLLIYLHVVAVFFHFFVKGENLIFPMFTGRKPRHCLPEGHKLRFARFSFALALFALACGIVWWLVR